MKKQQNYPLHEVIKFDNIREMLDLAVQDNPNHIAFMYKENKQEKQKTYKEFQNDTFYLGTALSSINMDKCHIAIIGENSYNWVTVYLTVLQSNGVVVPIDKELPTNDIINVLKHSDSEVLFYAGKYEKNIKEIAENVPEVKYFIGFDLEKSDGKFLSYREFISNGKSLYEGGDRSFIDSKPNDTRALKMLVYTSGTTGMAKGVMLSEQNLMSCIYFGLQVCTVYTKCLSVLPYPHTYEAVAGILVSLHKRCTICINDSLKNVLKNLQLYKPDYIYLVPAFAEVFYKKIWANAKENKKDIALKALIHISNFLRFFGIDLRKKIFKAIHDSFGGNLKEIVCGGEQIRPEIGKFFESIGIELFNGYGITECSPLVSVNRTYFNDCSTVGIVLPCCNVKFENVTPEGDGEICVKGDIVMLGYYKNEELTKEAIKNGWFNTGDYGRMNEKRQLIITGRKKNLIVLDNGKNVFPEELENYIMSIPYVQEVIVRGIKNEHNIEHALLAEVFLNSDKVKELNVENIEETVKKDIAKVCQDLPVYKSISQVKIRDVEFPKTTTNKIKR